jgi:hypothetical protein
MPAVDALAVLNPRVAMAQMVSARKAVRVLFIACSLGEWCSLVDDANVIFRGALWYREK